MVPYQFINYIKELLLYIIYFEESYKCAMFGNILIQLKMYENYTNLLVYPKNLYTISPLIYAYTYKIRFVCERNC